MGGSYSHVTNGPGSYRGIDLIENLGDASECIEEMWDMIEFLSGREPWRVYEAYVAHLRKRCAHHAGTQPTMEGFEKYWEE